VNIFASGDLDEYKIEELLRKDSKIDAFGVGTRMGTSADRPYLDVIYKLCETQQMDGAFAPIMKLSEGKITLPGRKQVYRHNGDDGKYRKDVIALAGESFEAEPLLIKVMENGRITYELPSLNEIRSAAKQNLCKLPERYKKLVNPPEYPVELSKNLNELTENLTRRLTSHNKIEKTKTNKNT
jgi:nicotinate phosphoribosyltransferase